MTAPYAETLEMLFYAFKTETLDELSDDEVIEGMAAALHGPAQGLLEYLEGLNAAAEAVCALCRYCGCEDERGCMPSRARACAAYTCGRNQHEACVLAGL